MLKFNDSINIWFTSDLHINHDKPFVYKYRGFNSIQEMNKEIVQRFNSKVQPNDKVFILGDLSLGDLDNVKQYLTILNGDITVIRGNHDTDTKVEYYESLGWKVYDALKIKWGKYRFFLCHYPCIISNRENSKYLSLSTICLYGHTHQKTNFYNDIPWCYHIGVDSHDCFPVSAKQIIEDIKEKLTDTKIFDNNI